MGYKIRFGEMTVPFVISTLTVIILSFELTLLSSRVECDVIGGENDICVRSPLPVKCNCSYSKNGGAKMKCHRLDSVNELNLLNYATADSLANLTQLDLSRNNISSLPAYSFPLVDLIKLNLDRNNIEVIEELAFYGLNNLSTLILSNNKLKSLRKNTFAGLSSLDTLKLNQNQLTTLSSFTFEPLRWLNKLNITGNPLICDCEIWWLRTSTVKLSIPLPKCDGPASLRGHVIEKIVSADGECLWDQLPHSIILNTNPRENQVVFENDSFELTCGIDLPNKYEKSINSNVTWTWEGQDPFSTFDGNSSDRSYEHDIMQKIDENGRSVLTIANLMDEHSGEWSCNFFVSQSLIEKSSINIFVISEKTVFCDVSVLETDRGIYTWPQTIAGRRVDLPCEMNDSGRNDSLATRVCSNNGTWLQASVSTCGYTSSVTRIFQQFSKMNLTNHRASLEESALRFRNYTQAHLNDKSDVVDLHYIVSTIENYVKFLDIMVELGEYLFEIVTYVLKLPDHLVAEAQQRHVVSSRLLVAVEAIYKYSSSLQYRNSDILVRQFPIVPDAFVRIVCKRVTSLLPSNAEGNESNVDCYKVTNTNETSSLEHGDVELRIRISSPLAIDDHPVNGTSPLKLIVTLFNDDRLFADGNKFYKSHHSIDDLSTSFDTLGAVLSISLKGMKVDRTDVRVSVNIALKANGNNPNGEDLSNSLSDRGLARWDPDSSTWIKESCRLASSSSSVSVVDFRCDRLGYFHLKSAVSSNTGRVYTRDENSSTRRGTNNGVKAVRITFLHPSVYVGTFVSVTCLIVASATYCLCYAQIQTSKKMKHSLANTWFSASFCFFSFSVGIRQTENGALCRTVGLTIHYFALATLFWMAVTVKALHKSVRKLKSGCASVSTPSSDDVRSPSAADLTAVRKPILGIYLVGWGIPCILCGIAGVVNIQGYLSRYSTLSHYDLSFSHHSYSYCFLSPGPSLNIILIPASFVLAYLFVMCMLVKCATNAARRSNPQLSVGTQAIDLELLDSSGIGAGGGGGGGVDENSDPFRREQFSVRSVTTPSSQMDDAEHSPAKQLRAFIVLLVLYLTATTSAALCVMLPIGWAYEEKVFGFMYALTSVLFGGLVVFFHCFARNDVRYSWKLFRMGKRCEDRCKIISSLPTTVSPSQQPHLPNSLMLTAFTSGKNGQFVSTTVVTSLMTATTTTTTNAAPVVAATMISACEQSAPVNCGGAVVASVSRDDRLERRSASPLDDVSVRLLDYSQPPIVSATVAHRWADPSGNALNAFYNPRQIRVAKKFFKKQRRKRENNTMSHANVVRKCRSGGSSPVSASLFGGDRLLVSAVPATLPRGNENDLDRGHCNRRYMAVTPLRYDETTEQSETHPLTYDEPNYSEHESKTDVDDDNLVGGAFARHRSYDGAGVVPIYTEISNCKRERRCRVPSHSCSDIRTLVPTSCTLSSSTSKTDSDRPASSNTDNQDRPRVAATTREQMCGTSDHDWCSCGTISDVNSEPTYNYAYIRGGGGDRTNAWSQRSSSTSPARLKRSRSRSAVSDEISSGLEGSNANGHLYTTLATVSPPSYPPSPSPPPPPLPPLPSYDDRRHSRRSRSSYHRLKQRSNDGGSTHSQQPEKRPWNGIVR